MTDNTGHSQEVRTIGHPAPGIEITLEIEAPVDLGPLIATTGRMTGQPALGLGIPPGRDNLTDLGPLTILSTDSHSKPLPPEIQVDLAIHVVGTTALITNAQPLASIAVDVIN